MASVWKLGGLTWGELCRRVWRTIYEGDFTTRTPPFPTISCWQFPPYFVLLAFALIYYFAPNLRAPEWH
jgi:uncharacterized BrkB/YihY/UPF0761 family membrane protein